MKQIKSKIIYFLVLLNFTVWLAVLLKPDDKLHIIACDVGQGDALLLQKKKTQILIDGGPNSRVIDCLSKYMPFWDREIELVILTHPQFDHYGGLIDVFDRYDIDTFLTNELENSNQSYQVLKNKLDIEGSDFLVANNLQDLEIGLIYLDIVHPSTTFIAQNYDDYDFASNPDKVLGSYTSADDPNEFSVTFNLRYKNFRMLFTGDLSPDVAQQLITTGLIEDVDVLKIPHHGSRNGLTQNLLDIAKPESSVISVGKNQWGHPHQEILQMLGDSGTDVLRTDQKGDIEIVTDGQKWWVD